MVLSLKTLITALADARRQFEGIDEALGVPFDFYSSCFFPSLRTNPRIFP
jgi:hypothetical protein